MRSRRGLLCLAPCLVLLGTMSASADTITLVSNNPGLFNDFLADTNSTAPNPLPSDAIGGVNYAGAFNAVVGYTGPANAYSGPTFVAYCVDLYHAIDTIPTQWTVNESTTLNDPTNPIVCTSAQLAYLFNMNSPTASLNGITAAALQIALWAVEYDGINVTYNNGGLGVYSIGGSSDLYQISSDSLDGNTAVSDAIGYIQNLQSASPSLVSAQLATFFIATSAAPSGEGFQDFITGTGPGFSPNFVPEPSSIALMVVGLGAVSFGVRKGRKPRRDV